MRPPTALLLLLSTLTFSSASPSTSDSLLQVYPRSTSLTNCLNNANISTVTSSSSDYQADIAAYNQRVQPKPVAVIYPTSPAQISSALKCAASAQVPVSSRGGGHSYASFGLGGTDGALVIDMSKFKSIKVDSTGKASIGAGSRLGDIALALNKKGWALSHGTCPFVGIGGHASFGGFGLAARQWGLMLDSITSYDVVLANGTILNGVTKSNNSDLFFALNGAAPSFAIITTFHHQAQHAPPNAVIWSYSYQGIDSSEAAEIFDNFQKYGNLTAPANLGMQLTIGTGGSVTVSGVWYGPEGELGTILSPLTSALPSGYTSSIESYSWIDSLQQLAGSQKLNTTGQKNNRDDFYAKSLLTPAIAPLTTEVMTKFFDYLWDTDTNNNWFVQWDVYGGQYSEINTIQTTSESSFAQRGKLLSSQMYVSSPTYGQPYYQSGFDFADGMYKVITEGMTATGAWSPTSSDKNGYAAYINYVDPRLSGAQVENLYWGSLYPRLQSIKAKYDSNNLLRNPQSITLPS
ncbi:FAD-dependent oxidoreductase [Sporobolomyces salmoneus]|uniref:FAD-dependent oxidoreductase n=1 Tax=Sporobolomyces salmoneus TaxID=183962 RepID=UPI00317849EC